MYIPSNFADSVEEYWHLVNHVTVWDVGCERQVEISGPDGYEFMEYLTPRDLSTCQVGQAKYVVLTDERGGLINDPVLTRLEKNRFWLSTADSDVLLWAKGVAYHSDFDVQIREPDVSPMQVQGPKSKDLLRALVGPRVATLEYYHFLEATIDGIPVIVTRTGWSAEVGFEIYLCDGSRGTELWNRVMEAGKSFDIRPTGPSEYRRIEAGILNYPSDINLDHNPYEAGLGWLVDLDKKHDFIGRAALRQIKKDGPGGNSWASKCPATRSGGLGSRIRGPCGKTGRTSERSPPWACRQDSRRTSDTAGCRFIFRSLVPRSKSSRPPDCGP